MTAARLCHGCYIGSRYLRQPETKTAHEQEHVTHVPATIVLEHPQSGGERAGSDGKGRLLTGCMTLAPRLLIFARPGEAQSGSAKIRHYAFPESGNMREA